MADNPAKINPCLPINPQKPTGSAVFSRSPTPVLPILRHLLQRPGISGQKQQRAQTRRAFLPYPAFLLTFLLEILLAGSAMASEPLKVVAFEYPPFVMQHNDQVHGYGAEVLKLLSPNPRNRIHVHPLARARQELANSTFLIGLGTRLHHTESVKQGHILPVQVGSIQFVFFHARQHLPKIPQHTSLEEFRPYRICAQHDSAASQTLRAAGILFDPSSDLPSLFRKVGAGRCDLGLAIDLSITAHLLTEAQPGNWGVIPFPVMEVPVDLLINSQMKDAQKLAREWRMMADKLIRDGTLQKVAEKAMGRIAVPEGFLKFERKEDTP